MNVRSDDFPCNIIGLATFYVVLFFMVDVLEKSLTKMALKPRKNTFKG